MTSQPIATASHPHAHHFYAYQPHHPYYHDPALASLAYRPPHVPLQHQASSEHQHQLSLAAASGFHHPTFQQQQHYAPRTRQHTRQARAMAASFGQAQGTSEEELAELQKLSNEYEPEATVRQVHFWDRGFRVAAASERVVVTADHDLQQGPLVGQRQPSTAITTEYASADPVFQAKTAVSQGCVNLSRDRTPH